MLGQLTRAPLARLVAGVALLAVLAFAAAGTARAAGAPYVYTDKAGDSASAPDIQKVVLTDNGNGTVGVEIDVASILPDDGDSMVWFGIDADRNRQTGNSLGFEYGVGLDATGAWMSKWDNGAWVDFNHGPSSPTVMGGSLGFTLDLSDIGVTSFNFIVLSFHGDDGDAAPEYGSFGYPSQATTAAAIAGVLVKVATLFPKAGTTFSIATPQVKLTTGDIVDADIVVAVLSYKGQALKPVGLLAWKIPKSYKAKRLTLKVLAIYGGTTKSVSLTVIPT